jgi:hypothetical protein
MLSIDLLIDSNREHVFTRRILEDIARYEKLQIISLNQEPREPYVI